MKKAVLILVFLCFIASQAMAINAQAAKYYKVANAYHKKNDFKKAISYYNAAVKKEKKFWQAWLGLGICYYNLKKYRNAKLIFKYTLVLNPNEKTAKRYIELLDPKFEKKEVKQKKNKSKGELLWRSALLPGAGQFYNDELVKGYIYTLSYLASIAAIIKYTMDQQAAVDAYANANYDFENKYKEIEDATIRVWIPIGTAATIWIVSMVDAYMSGTDVPAAGSRRAENIMEYRPGLDVAVKLGEFRF